MTHSSEARDCNGRNQTYVKPYKNERSLSRPYSLASMCLLLDIICSGAEKWRSCVPRGNIERIQKNSKTTIVNVGSKNRRDEERDQDNNVEACLVSKDGF